MEDFVKYTKKEIINLYLKEASDVLNVYGRTSGIRKLLVKNPLLLLFLCRVQFIG